MNTHSELNSSQKRKRERRKRERARAREERQTNEEKIARDWKRGKVGKERDKDTIQRCNTIEWSGREKRWKKKETKIQHIRLESGREKKWRGKRTTARHYESCKNI